MGRLLDEDTIIKVLEHWKEAFRENSHYVSASDLSLVVKDVRELPSAQTEPQEGHWINTSPGYENGFYSNSYYCSECHDYYTTSPYEMKFCPNCGAKMRGEQHETD